MEQEAEEIVDREECLRVLHAMGFTSAQAFNLLGRIMQHGDAYIPLNSLIETVNETVVVAASRNDVALLRVMFREDVLERDASCKSFAAVLSGGMASSSNTTTPTPAQALTVLPRAPLKITEPVILFAVHWQRYASCQIGNDFTSLAAAFEKHFPSVKLPPWLWKRACLQPTPSVEECFHFVTHHTPVTEAPGYWMVGNVAYRVSLEGSNTQKIATADGQHDVPNDGRVLDPDHIETDWICKKQADLEYDLRSDSLDDLGAMIANALSVHPSHCALNESSLLVQRDSKAVRLVDVFPNVVFHHVTRLLAGLEGVVSVRYDSALTIWRVVYDGVRPHELLLRSCAKIIQTERAILPAAVQY